MAEITVDTDDLVTLTQLAEELETGRSTVAMWDARRATTRFPRPLIDLPASRSRLWSRKEVLAWLNDSQ